MQKPLHWNYSFHIYYIYTYNNMALNWSAVQQFGVLLSLSVEIFPLGETAEIQKSNSNL